MKLRSAMDLVVLLCVLIGSPVFLYLRQIQLSEPARRETCINNLRLIDGAKQMWAMENQKTNSDTPAWGDIRQYLSRCGGDDTPIPTCPSGGTYTLGRMDQKPTCSIRGHALP
jgi:hypothetical protein